MYCLFVVLVISPFGFEDKIFVLVVPVYWSMLTLYHYENMSMQYTAIFHGSKNEKFSDKMI